jgi:hypothetical protein
VQQVPDLVGKGFYVDRAGGLNADDMPCGDRSVVFSKKVQGQLFQCVRVVVFGRLSAG